MGKFLASLLSLVVKGDIKKIEQAYKFAKQEFGEITPLLKKQIERIFSQVKKPKVGKEVKKEAEVIPFKKEGIETLKNDKSIMDQIDKSKNKIEGASNRITEIQKEIDGMYKPKPDVEDSSDLMKRLEDKVSKMKITENISTGLTRTIAREILGKKGIELPKGSEPLEVFKQKFGQDVLIDVNNLAEELIEMDRRGIKPKPLTQLIEEGGFFDVKMPKEPPQGFTPDELADVQKEVDQEDILLKFDPTDRDPNAEGGRIGYADGNNNPKKLIKKIPKVGKIVSGLESLKSAIGKIMTKFGDDAITTADRAPTPPKTLERDMFKTADNRINKKEGVFMEDGKTPDYDYYKEILDDAEDSRGFNVAGDETIEELLRREKDIKDEYDYMYDQYRIGKLDPEPGSKSQSRLNLLKKRKEEAELTDDYRLFSRDDADELDELEEFLDQDYRRVKAEQAEEQAAKELAPKMVERLKLKQKYPGITDDLLDKILIDDNPQRKAEVLGSLDETFKMMEKGMSPDEIIDTFKNVTRTKNSEGGFNTITLDKEFTKVFEDASSKKLAARDEKQATREKRYRELIASNKFPELNNFFREKIIPRVQANIGGPFTTGQRQQRANQSYQDYLARQQISGTGFQPGTGNNPVVNFPTFNSPTTTPTPPTTTPTPPTSGGGGGGTGGGSRPPSYTPPNTGGGGSGGGGGYYKGPKKYFTPGGGSSGGGSSGGGKTSVGFDFSKKGGDDEIFADKTPGEYYKTYLENYYTNRNPLDALYGAISPNQILTYEQQDKARELGTFDDMWDAYTNKYEPMYQKAYRERDDLLGLSTDAYGQKFYGSQKGATADDMAMYDMYGDIQNLNPEFYNEDGSLKMVQNPQSGVLPGFTRLDNPNSVPGNYDEFMYKGPDGNIYGPETYSRMAASGSYKDLYKDYYDTDKTPTDEMIAPFMKEGEKRFNAAYPDGDTKGGSQTSYDFALDAFRESQLQKDGFITAREAAGLEEGKRDEKDFLGAVEYLGYEDDELDKLRNPFKSFEDKEADYKKKIEEFESSEDFRNPDDAILDAIAKQKGLEGPDARENAQEEYRRRLAEDYGIKKPEEDTRQNLVGAADMSTTTLKEVYDNPYIQEAKKSLGFDNITERSSTKQKRGFLKSISDLASKFRLPLTAVAFALGGPQGAKMANKVLGANEMIRKAPKVIDSLKTFAPGDEKPDYSGLIENVTGKDLSDLTYGLPQPGASNVDNNNLIYGQPDVNTNVAYNKGGRVKLYDGGIPGFTEAEIAQRRQQEQQDAAARNVVTQPSPQPFTAVGGGSGLPPALENGPLPGRDPISPELNSQPIDQMPMLPGAGMPPGMPPGMPGQMTDPVTGMPQDPVLAKYGVSMSDFDKMNMDQQDDLHAAVRYTEQYGAEPYTQSMILKERGINPDQFLKADGSYDKLALTQAKLTSDIQEAIDDGYLSGVTLTGNESFQDLLNLDKKYYEAIMEERANTPAYDPSQDGLGYDATAGIEQWNQQQAQMNQYKSQAGSGAGNSLMASGGRAGFKFGSMLETSNPNFGKQKKDKSHEYLLRLLKNKQAKQLNSNLKKMVSKSRQIKDKSPEQIAKAMKKLQQLKSFYGKR